VIKPAAGYRGPLAYSSPEAVPTGTVAIEGKLEGIRQSAAQSNMRTEFEISLSQQDVKRALNRLERGSTPHALRNRTTDASRTKRDGNGGLFNAHRVIWWSRSSIGPITNQWPLIADHHFLERW
jgi:hypothetical protein